MVVILHVSLLSLSSANAFQGTMQKIKQQALGAKLEGKFLVKHRYPQKLLS